MAQRSSLPPDDVEALSRAAKEAFGHPQRKALGALALDVLSRQAEARVLFAGKEFVQKRVEEHGASRETASTHAGNLVGILERGPETEAERALVVAFAVVGLDARFEAASSEDRRTLVDRFARQVDWLEAATPYSVWSIFDRAASPALAGAFWSEVAQAVVDEAGDRGRGAISRGRNAARISAMAASGSEAAKKALAQIAESRLDPVTHGVLEAISGTTGTGGGTRARITGRHDHSPRRGVLRFLSLVSGLALLGWVLRAIGKLAGVRGEAELSLDGSSIEIRERRFAFGRQVTERKDTVVVSSIVAAGREVRFPQLHLYVGAIALAVGVLTGGTWIFEGARSGELVLLSIGAGLLLAGAALDLALDVLVPATHRRVALELALHRGRTLRVAGVTIEDADRFLEALRAAR
jgi:hypothetical protein